MAMTKKQLALCDTMVADLHNRAAIYKACGDPTEEIWLVVAIMLKRLLIEVRNSRDTSA